MSLNLEILFHVALAIATPENFQLSTAKNILKLELSE